MSDYTFWKKQGIKGSDFKILNDVISGLESELGRQLEPDESHLINQKMNEFGINLGGAAGAVKQFQEAATKKGLGKLEIEFSLRRGKDRDSE